MAINPMQRKARNSFLLGMLLTLLITGIIIAILFVQLANNNKAKKQENANKVTVYALAKDVKSGAKLEYGDFITVSVDASTVSANAVSSLYDIFGDDEKVTAKIAMNANTIVTPEMVIKEGEELTNDIRKQEYNMIQLPTNIEDGDYIDIRFMLPSGQDFIVVSKKQVKIPVINYMYSSDTIILELSEEETLAMSSAIVEAWRLSGAKLYATPYVEPGMQTAATPTYPVNQSVYSEIIANPNIVNDAKNALNSRYEQQLELRNRYIEGVLGNEENSDENLEAGMTDSVTKSQEDRAAYLETLVPTY